MLLKLITQITTLLQLHFWFPAKAAREDSLFHESQTLTCATLMPVQKQMFPIGCTACSLDSILPVSGVSVVSTSQLLHRHITQLCVITLT